MTDPKEIRRWMRLNVERFIDKKTGEVDMTRMVEVWELEATAGEGTTDPDHPAWFVAAKIAEETNP